MSKLTLYGFAASSNVLKARMLLAELGLDYELVDVPQERPRPAWLEEFHPLGTVPVLRDGDAVIGESNTILRYLAARAGRDDLYPADLVARAKVDWLLDTWSMHVRPPAIAVERPALFGPEPDTAAVQAALPAYVEVLEKVERLLTGTGSLLAPGLTIADISAAPTLYRANKVFDAATWARLPKLRAAADAILSHPSFLAAGAVR